MYFHIDRDEESEHLFKDDDCQIIEAEVEPDGGCFYVDDIDPEWADGEAFIEHIGEAKIADAFEEQREADKGDALYGDWLAEQPI